MGYPKTLYKTVNSLDEEKAAIEQGCTVDPEGTSVQEYPKMLYAHPVDKTKEHKTLVVNSPEEKDDALAKGYKVEPHIPASEEDQFEETQYEAAAPTDDNLPEVDNADHA